MLWSWNYKIKVAQDGFYRIPFSVLQQGIPNISSLLAKNLVLFHNGAKVPIYISTDSLFTSIDYIEFYGKKNVGDVDSMLYKNGNLQPHPYYSLFNDTSTYYLTTTTSTNNPRFTEVQNNLGNITVDRKSVV